MNPSESLAGRVAVVTGASRGLGLYIARELAGAGATVVLTGRDRRTLQEAAERVGGAAVVEVCDHADETSVRDLAKRVGSDHGAPHILVNNAGALPKRAPVVDLSAEDWRRIIDTNLTGVFLTTKAFLPGMIERGGGEIVMIASTSGLRADPEALRWWELFSSVKGQGIWISSAREYESGVNQDPMLAIAAWLFKNAQDRAALATMGHLK